jgi:peptide/nickel transport system permease protein
MAEPASTLSATTTELVERDEVSTDTSATGEGGSAIGGALRLLLAAGPGRTGIALFVAMLGISIYVLVAYPLDFGRARWSNPNYWADYPKTAPPVWTTWLGGEGVPHTTLTESAPSETRTIPAGEIRTYRFPLSFESDRFPTFLSFTVNGVSYSKRAPSFGVTLERPDGGQIRLASLAVPAPRPGETAPYRRYFETPNRLLLTSQETAAQSLAQIYAQIYPGVQLPANLNDQLAAGLFARPRRRRFRSARSPPWGLLAERPGGGQRSDRPDRRPAHGDGRDRVRMDGDRRARPRPRPRSALRLSGRALDRDACGDPVDRDRRRARHLSGYAGGVTDAVIQRLSDIISQVPVLPLLIFLVFVLGSHLYLIILVLVAFSWPGLTILVRSMVLQIRSGQLVEAAKAMGASRRRIMLRHVFPQTAPFIVAQMIFFAPGAILAEASLSFLGLGDPSVPTWGQMLEAGFRTGALYVGYWWWVIPPGILIVVTALAFMLLALAMEPIVDPRLRKV